jgi:hypothetical protein
VRCTTGAGAGGGGGAVLVLEKEKQPEPSVAAARTSPRDTNFVMQVPPAKASLRMLPTVSRNDDREKRFGAAAEPNQFTTSPAASSISPAGSRRHRPHSSGASWQQTRPGLSAGVFLCSSPLAFCRRADIVF